MTPLLWAVAAFVYLGVGGLISLVWMSQRPGREGWFSVLAALLLWPGVATAVVSLYVIGFLLVAMSWLAGRLW